MTAPATYVRDGAEIYRRSFATIRAEADLSGLPRRVAPVAVRMIHACGQVDLVDDLAFSPGVVAAARGALRAGAPILCDAADGGLRRHPARLPADNDVVCTLRDPRVPALAAAAGHHPQRRGAGAVGRPARRRGRRDRQRADRAVPPAGDDRRRRAAPGGGARHPGRASSARPSPRTRWPRRSDLEYLVVRGRRGGSAITAAAVNAIAERGGMTTVTGHGRCTASGSAPATRSWSPSRPPG